MGLLVLVCQLPWSRAEAQTVEYIHTDALGTPIAVTDANRVVIERSEYEPYGKLLNRPLTDGPGFTGHVQDAATGLTYMQQRYYDPGIGRFLSVDPVTADSNTGSNFNRYKYGNNNPYRFIDPDGRLDRELAAWRQVAAEELRVVQVSRIDDGPITPLYPESILPAVRLVRSLAQGGEALKQAQRPTERGKESEKRVLDEMGEAKNTEVSKTSSGNTIPDFKNGRQVGEIKDTQRVTDTKQLRAQREYANETGREHTVVTGNRTKVSKTVEQKSVVIRRDDLGPRP
jgi:RHS repeat-associated protein